MNNLDILKNEREIFLNYMKAKYPLHYNSNIFLRDLQYAVRRFFENKNIVLSYTKAEILAMEFAALLESDNDLLRLDANTWRVNFHIDEKENSLVQEPQE